MVSLPRVGCAEVVSQGFLCQVGCAEGVSQGFLVPGGVCGRSQPRFPCLGWAAGKWNGAQECIFGARKVQLGTGNLFFVAFLRKKAGWR